MCFEFAVPRTIRFRLGLTFFIIILTVYRLDVSAQSISASRFYLGPEIAIDKGYGGVNHLAYGIQAGWKTEHWFLGGNLGIGRIAGYQAPVTRPVPYYPTDGPDGDALLIGLHGGVFIGWGIGIGAVMVESVGPGNHYFLNSDGTVGSSSINWWEFDFGGDLHIETSEHYMINFAYSPKRGFNFGVDYVL